MIWSEATGERRADAAELFAEMESAAAEVAKSLGAGTPLTVVHAGRRLGIHANTVACRVRRAESLIGRALTERQLELRVALRLIPLQDRRSGT